MILNLTSLLATQLAPILLLKISLRFPSLFRGQPFCDSHSSQVGGRDWLQVGLLPLNRVEGEVKKIRGNCLVVNGERYFCFSVQSSAGVKWKFTLSIFQIYVIDCAVNNSSMFHFFNIFSLSFLIKIPDSDFAILQTVIMHFHKYLHYESSNFFIFE